MERRGHVTGEQMHVARFLGAGLTRENFGEWRLAAHQEVESGVDRVKILEGIHSFGACAEFAGGLRPTEEQDAEHGNFVAMEIVEFVEAMLEFWDARIAAGRANESLIGECTQGFADSVLVESHDGLAIGSLVAGVEKGVQRQGIVLRSGAFFFDECAQDAGFDFGE